MRIFVGSIQQETNSFSPLRAAYEDFDMVRGEAMLDKIAATPVFRAAGAELVPSFYAHALPSGRLSLSVFTRLLAELLNALRESLPLDGVWLYLHGALEVDGSPTFSGDCAIAKAVRETVGDTVPVAVAMDFHANHDPDIVNHVNILRGYRTAPHADMPETQVRAAELLVRCIREGMLPRPVIETIPVIMAGDMVITADPPINALNARLDEIEKDPDILTVSFFNGQNWVDSPRNHASALAVALPGKEAKAAAYTREIAEVFWNMRRDFRFLIPALPPEEALAEAAASPESTVFVTDSGDNTTAGAGGASAFFLRTALRTGAKNILFAGLYDPTALKVCEEEGPGACVALTLGEEAVPFAGTVVSLHDIDGWDGEPAGRGALVRGDGVDVIVCERRCAFTTPEIIASGGAYWKAYKIVVVKLGYLYPRLAAVAPKAMLATTPGASSVDIAHIPFRHVSRPIWPLDEMETYR